MLTLTQHHTHELESSRGDGMHVAVIDSGLGKSLEGIAVGEVIDLTGSKGGPQEGVDEIGHGTACIDLIARVAPDATISSIKVFGEELRAYPAVILQALDQCKEIGVDMVNLSLGTMERDWEDELYAACQDLSDAGILLVSANRDPGLLSSPAKFDCVYGVNGGRVRGKYGYFYDPDAIVQFIARGDRQRVVWKEGRKALIAASSFAAARVSGIVLLLEQRRRLQGGGIEEQFHRFSAEVAPPMVHQNGNEATPTWISGAAIRGRELIKPDIGWIGRAGVYPFNKEMRSLVRFADQLSFEIASVVDIPPSKLKGLDAGEAIGAESVGASVQLVLEEALDGVDTLIIGHLDAYSEAKRKDLLQEALEVCLVKGCNVYSLSRTCLLYEVPYADLFEKRGLRLVAPVVDKEVYRSFVSAFAPDVPITCPVLGVFGTSQDQGKVTAQLLIRKELKRRGYATSWLATEHQGELLGADYTFPNGYEGLVSVDIPMEGHVTLLQSAMVGIAQSTPDIVLVGSQSGVSLPSLSEKHSLYSLPAIATMFGTAPDAYVLLVNEFDELEHIEDCLAVLRGLGKADTIALAFIARQRQILEGIGRPITKERVLDESQVDAMESRLNDATGLPAVCISFPEGVNRVVNLVEDYFDSNRQEE